MDWLLEIELNGMAYTDAKYQEIRAKIAQAIQELPALPDVLMRVLEETQREDVTAEQLQQLIASDQALAAKTLRVVNSAYYGLSKQVDSLSQAIVVLGMLQIRNLALSISAMGLFRAMTSTQREMHRKFWMHSIASACAAQIIARKKRLPQHDQEIAFLGGLLHDLGRLFLLTNFTETYVEIEQMHQAGEDLHDLEIKALGVTHAQVGQVLAHVWKFPARIGELMGSHDGPFMPGSSALPMIVHAAHHFANMANGQENAMERVDPFVAQWLTDLAEDLASIQSETEAKSKGFESAFSQMAA